MLLQRVSSLFTSTAGSLALAGSLLFASSASAAPLPTRVDGAVSDGQQIVVRGSGFGSKAQAAPLIFDQVNKAWINGQDTQSYGLLQVGAAVSTGSGYPWVRGSTGGVETLREGSFYTYGCNLGDKNCWMEYPAGFPDPATKQVSEVYLRWWVKPSFDPSDYSGSHKFVRLWDSRGSDSVGVRISWTQMHLTGPRKSCSSNGTVGTKSSWGNWGGQAGKWNLMELYANAKTGVVQARTNGKLIHNITDWNPGRYKCVGGQVVSDGVYNGLQPRLWGMNGSGDANWSGEQFKMTAYYADRTRARVEIGDAPRWEDVRVREAQVPLEWSNNEIKVSLYDGLLGGFEGKYLYVVDASGNVNAEGLPLAGGAQQSGKPKPPTIVSR